MRNRWCLCFGKKNSQPTNHVNKIEPQSTSEKTTQAVAPYHIVFIDTVFGDLAAQTVNIYTQQNARMMGDGWLCGTIPNLDGATLWAHPKGKFNYETLITLLSKLREPVRLMICIPYGERFVDDANYEMFMQLKDIFAASGKAEIVIVGGPLYSRAKLLGAIYEYGDGVSKSVNNFLCDDATQSIYWWAGGTQAYYDGLPADGSIAVNSEASRLLKSLRGDHGVKLDISQLPLPEPVRWSYHY